MTIFWMSGNFVVEWNFCWLKLNKYFCWMKLVLLKLNKYFCWMKLFALKLKKYFCWMKIISCWILQHLANHKHMNKINKRQNHYQFGNPFAVSLHLSSSFWEQEPFVCKFSAVRKHNDFSNRQLLFKLYHRRKTHW